MEPTIANVQGHDLLGYRGGDALTRLSPREREVLALAATGLTNEEVAARLAVSVHAVKFHLAGVYRKLEVANRTEAAMVYLRQELSTDSGASELAEQA
jgi:DNA-binding CsgD family transcriptional regulator